MLGMMVLMLAQSTTAPAIAKPAPSKLICIQVQQLGSRLGGQRTCRTKAEWDQDRRDARMDTENAQRTNSKE